MHEEMKPSPTASPSREIENLVAEVAGDAHIDVASLKADEKQFLEEHALKKP